MDRSAILLACFALSAPIGGCSGSAITGGGTALDDGDTAAPGTPAADGASSSGRTTTGSVFRRTGGSFSALPLDVVDGTAFLRPALDTDGGAKSRLLVILEDHAGVCGFGPFQANTTILIIDALSGSAAFGPGTYSQMFSSVPGQVDVSLSRLNDQCASAGADFGASTATVIVSEVTTTRVRGTVSVNFIGGTGTLEGAFDVAVCDNPIGTSCAQ